MKTIERKELSRGDDRQADEFTDALREFLTNWDYDLVVFMAHDPDGNLFAIENRQHIKKVIIGQGDIH